MLFPSPAQVNTVWAAVARATAEGELGCAAKVSTAPDEASKLGRARLICIYTVDFADMEDLRRILRNLTNMGLVSGKDDISYKCGEHFLLFFSLSLPPAPFPNPPPPGRRNKKPRPKKLKLFRRLLPPGHRNRQSMGSQTELISFKPNALSCSGGRL